MITWKYADEKGIPYEPFTYEELALRYPQYDLRGISGYAHQWWLSECKMNSIWSYEAQRKAMTS